MGVDGDKISVLTELSRHLALRPLSQPSLYSWAQELLTQITSRISLDSLRMSNRLTEAAYQALPGGPLDVDKAFYTRLADAPRDLLGGCCHYSPRPLSDLSRNLTRVMVEFILPIRSGKAWKIQAGDICRISTPEGPQVRPTIILLQEYISSNTGRRSKSLQRTQSTRTHVGFSNSPTTTRTRIPLRSALE
jgi:hypothetical protein